jgi:hypothetical protein
MTLSSHDRWLLQEASKEGTFVAHDVAPGLPGDIGVKGLCAAGLLEIAEDQPKAGPAGDLPFYRTTPAGREALLDEMGLGVA